MRKRILFNDGWVFLNNGERDGVSLPHTWNKDDGATGFEYFVGGSLHMKKSFLIPWEVVEGSL